MNYKKKFKKILYTIDVIEKASNKKLRENFKETIKDDIHMIESHIDYFKDQLKNNNTDKKIVNEESISYENISFVDEKEDIPTPEPILADKIVPESIEIDKFINNIADEVINKLSKNFNFVDMINMRMEADESITKGNLRVYMNKLVILEDEKLIPNLIFRDLLTSDNNPDIMKLLPFNNRTAIVFTSSNVIYVTPSLYIDYEPYIKDNVGYLSKTGWYIKLDVCKYSPTMNTFIPTTISVSIDGLISICDKMIEFVMSNFDMNSIVEGYFNDIKNTAIKMNIDGAENIDYFRKKEYVDHRNIIVEPEKINIDEMIKYIPISSISVMDIPGLYIKEVYYKTRDDEALEYRYICCYKELVLLLDTSMVAEHNEKITEAPILN